jgi:AbrB family looped-hinge helix DNA binding protein
MEDFNLAGSTTIGERGQVVIPASIRDELGLKAGEKLLVFMPRKGMICMIEPKEFESHFNRMFNRFRDFKEKIREDI